MHLNHLILFINSSFRRLNIQFYSKNTTYTKVKHLVTYLVLVELHLADDEHLKSSLILVDLPPHILLCIRCACCWLPMQQTLIYILHKSKVLINCNFCNKELKLCLLYVFSNMFPFASDEMWQDCVLAIVSISDVFTQEETMNLTKK